MLFGYVNYGGVHFYQSNCEGKLDYTLSPNVASESRPFSFAEFPR